MIRKDKSTWGTPPLETAEFFQTLILLPLPHGVFLLICSLDSNRQDCLLKMPLVVLPPESDRPGFITCIFIYSLCDLERVPSHPLENQGNVEVKCTDSGAKPSEASIPALCVIPLLAVPPWPSNPTNTPGLLS